HDKNHIQVTYDERVEQASAENINNYAINEDISIEGAELGEDYRTVTLSVSDLEKGIEYELTTENVKDMANNTSGLLTVNFYRHDDEKVVHWDILDDEDFITDLTGNGNNATVLNADNRNLNGHSYIEGPITSSLQGKEDIAIVATINTSLKEEQSIVKQKNEEGLQYELKVNEDGYVEWITGTEGTGFHAVSEVKVNNGKSNHIVAVREANGLGNIYINGELLGSDYNEDEERKGIKADLEAGSVLVGENFTGKLDDVQIYNRGISYSEAEELANSNEEEPFSEEISQENWKVHDVSSEETNKEQGTGKAEDAFDDDPTSFWHSQYHPEIKK